MSTALSKVVSAVIATLAAQPPVCKRIYRARTKPLPAQDVEAINVAYGRDVGDETTIRGGRTDHKSQIHIECFAKSSTDSADAAVDPLLELVSERMYIDTTLGGIVDDFAYIGLDPENSSESMEEGWVRLIFIATYSTTKSFLT